MAKTGRRRDDFVARTIFAQSSHIESRHVPCAGSFQSHGGPDMSTRPVSPALTLDPLLSDFDFDLPPSDLIARHPATPARRRRGCCVVGRGGPRGSPGARVGAGDPAARRSHGLQRHQGHPGPSSRARGPPCDGRGNPEVAVEVTPLKQIRAAGDRRSLAGALAKPGRRLAKPATGSISRAGLLRPRLLSKGARGRDRPCWASTVGEPALMEALASAWAPCRCPRTSASCGPIESAAMRRTTRRSMHRPRARSPRPPPGLHFTPELLAAARRAWASSASTLTLHVGAGTFLPVKAEHIALHRMHAEWGEIAAGRRRGDQPGEEAGRPTAGRGRHHLAAPAGKPRPAKDGASSGPSRARRTSSSRPAMVSAP